MDFLGIGGGEILFILLVGLLLWGPNRIIEASRTLGRTLQAFRKATSNLTAQVSHELEEQKKMVAPPKQDK